MWVTSPIAHRNNHIVHNKFRPQGYIIGFTAVHAYGITRTVDRHQRPKIRCWIKQPITGKRTDIKTQPRVHAAACPGSRGAYA